MGGGDWTNQQQQIQKAYLEVKPVVAKQVQKNIVEEKPCDDLFAEIKVDALDKLYIQTRTIVDSWVIWVLILIGVLTTLPFFLKKFGVTIQSPFTKKGK